MARQYELDIDGIAKDVLTMSVPEVAVKYGCSLQRVYQVRYRVTRGNAIFRKPKIEERKTPTKEEIYCFCKQRGFSTASIILEKTKFDNAGAYEDEQIDEVPE